MTCAPKKCGPGGPQIFQTGADQPPAIYCWNIAEKNCDPVKILIKESLFRKWDQLLTHCAQKCGCGMGCRALYSPDGKQFKELSEFTEGMDVVVIPTGDKFTKANIPLKLKAKLGIQ